MRFEFPGGVIRGQRGRGLTPTLFNRRGSGQPFQAVTMIGAVSSERIPDSIVRYTHVPHFRMPVPVHQTAMEHTSSSHTGPDGEIEEGVQASRRAPTVFTKRGGVDIGVKRNFHLERVSDRAGEIKIPPSRFRR